MLTLWGKRQHFCDGISRRNFLKIGAFGAGLSLAEMLRLRAAAGTGSAAGASSVGNKAAIMIYLPGGPSHIDMYDLKPDAPKEFRGEFKPIATNVPGVQICEHFPLQARMWDKLAVVRSLVSVDEHSDSLVMTGYRERVNRTAHHPSFGAVMSKLRGAAAGDIPPFVSLRGMSRRHRARLPRRGASALHAGRPRLPEPASGRRRRCTAYGRPQIAAVRLRRRSAATSTPPAP